MPNFTWATEANYPAGANPWNGQPLSVAPAGDYFLPGVPIAAENVNWCLQQVSQNIISAVTSLANLRALPVPTGSGAVLCTPENTSQTISGIGSGIGGLYYYDAAYTNPDNYSTTIKPTAVTGSNPGRWRLQGAMCLPIADVYQDSNQGGSTYFFFATIAGSTSSAVQLKNGSSNPLSALGTTFTTGTSAGNMFLGDVIDLVAQVDLTLTNPSTTSFMAASAYWTRNGTTQIGAPITFAAYLPAGGSSVDVAAQELRLRYVVTSADISGGTLAFDVYAAPISSFSGQTLGFGINRFTATLRRF